MNASVGSAGYSHSKVVFGVTENRVQRLDQFGLHCAQPELLCPTVKVGAVVTKVNTKAKRPVNR
jgi:hypothetical protein